MIPFDPENPFPLLEFGTYSYLAAKNHAVFVDEFLKLNIHEIERRLRKEDLPDTAPQEAWIGLDPQSFLTPYIEIRTALELLQMQPGDRIVDLGCGYARMAHILGKHYPGIFFIGYELVRERMIEACRALQIFSYSTWKVEQRDLLQSAPEPAEHYFIYDFGSNYAIGKTLHDLQEIAKQKSIQVLARGRASRMLIHQNHPWLSEIQTPRHFDTFSIYRS